MTARGGLSLSVKMILTTTLLIVVTVVGSDFFDAVEFVLGKDADDLRIQDSDFDQEFDADGGAGEDALDFDGSVTFEPLAPQRIVGFEGTS